MQLQRLVFQLRFEQSGVNESFSVLCCCCCCCCCSAAAQLLPVFWFPSLRSSCGKQHGDPRVLVSRKILSFVNIICSRGTTQIHNCIKKSWTSRYRQQHQQSSYWWLFSLLRQPKTTLLFAPTFVLPTSNKRWSKLLVRLPLAVSKIRLPALILACPVARIYNSEKEWTRLDRRMLFVTARANQSADTWTWRDPR